MFDDAAVLYCNRLNPVFFFTHTHRQEHGIVLPASQLRSFENANWPDNNRTLFFLLLFGLKLFLLCYAKFQPKQSETQQLLRDATVYSRARLLGRIFWNEEVCCSLINRKLQKEEKHPPFDHCWRDLSSFMFLNPPWVCWTGHWTLLLNRDSNRRRTTSIAVPLLPPWSFLAVRFHSSHHFWKISLIHWLTRPHRSSLPSATSPCHLRPVRS